jgi:crotonobetainyl-CoA:carnitine CoA-transferase CaiB-like acyl-CoA transferase
MDILEGIQVVDLSHGTAGPVVGMFLADFSAEVIKAEPPGGDPARSLPWFAAWNRGKKGVVRDPQLIQSEFVRVRPGADGAVIASDPMPQAFRNAYR